MSSQSRSSGIDENAWSEVRRRDRRLVAACLAGDGEAWNEMWVLYGPLVKATARRAGCSDDDVSEVLQRTALVALQGLDRLRRPEKLAGWLAGIARFQTIELFRSNRPTVEIFEEALPSDEDPEADLVRDQEIAGLYSALSVMDPRCKTIIVRLELDDPPASYREVAEQVGLAPASIGPIRRRCLKRLRKVYEVSQK